MKFLASMISKFDAVELRFTHLTSGDELAKNANEFLRDTTPKRFYEAYDSIDTKATAILQHVSVMIAVSSILFAQATFTVLKIIFVCELLLYIFLALSCLRLLMTQGMLPNQAEDVVAKETILDITAKLTFLLSIALVITVIAEVLITFL